MAQNYGYGGGRSNQYDQRSNSPAQAPYPTGTYDSYGAPPQQQQQQPYGRQQQYNAPQNRYDRPQNQYNTPAMGRDDYTGQNVEMEPLAPNRQQFPQQSGAVDFINECEEIRKEIAAVQRSLISLKSMQKRYVDAPDSIPGAKNQLEAKSAEVMSKYRGFVAEIRTLKSRPESNSPMNKKRLGIVDQSLKDAMREFQMSDADFQRQMENQMARQWLIVHPESSEEEAREAALNPRNEQVFAQALLQSDRRGDARTVMSQVQSRHQDIQRIAEQFAELNRLMEQMDQIVAQQEDAVANIEMKGEEVVHNVHSGTEQIGVAVKSARNARKWKWWCLGISVLIIVIIVIIVLLYQFVFGPNAKSNRDSTKQKRFVIPETLSADFHASKPFDSDSKLALPGLEWTSNNELVRKTKRFEA